MFPNKNITLNIPVKRLEFIIAEINTNNIPTDKLPHPKTFINLLNFGSVKITPTKHKITPITLNIIITLFLFYYLFVAEG